MNGNSDDTRELLRRVEEEGSESVVGELFQRYRERLRRMVKLRMDRRLRGRIDDSDVLQEAYVEALGSFPGFLRSSSAPFYLWLRCIVGRKLMDLHRYHLGAQVRDARREANVHGGALPRTTSESLAAQLLGHLTSPTEAVVREERRFRLQEALDEMEELDREIVALRYFEQLSNVEAAQVLEIPEWAARRRHLNVLRRLKEVLKSV